MYRHDRQGPSAAPPLLATRLLDQVRERVRYLHCSLQTEKAHLHWARYFIRWHARQAAVMRHPRDPGAGQVQALLVMLADERRVSPATHRQALNGPLFLYRQMRGLELPRMQPIGRPLVRKYPRAGQPKLDCQATGIPATPPPGLLREPDAPAYCVRGARSLLARHPRRAPRHAPRA